MTVDDRDPLDLLVEQFTSAVRRGESADVEGWAERHPEHADAIRELFPTVLAIEGLRDESDRSDTGPRAGIGMIERLGDYRIVAEIGRGGMGVVYEAEQESLGRRVAVKVLPPLRDPKRMRRFEREARTAARLHHTNIVPIFGVGEQDGWHYYVMQVIRGVGLDVVLRALRRDAAEHPDRARHSGLAPEEAIRMLRTGAFRSGSRSASSDVSSGETSAAEATPSRVATPPHAPPDPGPPGEPRAPYWRSVADIGRQVAEALSYAHAQGVLHRDVKPGNLLIDAHGVVWVTDFGLAKAIGHDGLTMSGDLVGTLQYMAPEQLHGRYDTRTDVYGLGLTLYELLTLRPAFADSDRGGLVQKIEQGHPTPPSGLRPGIPRDLETIVLKAVQHDPRHRYQTAAELGEDLQRFLEDRPIRARRATAVEQLWRWCRRNRAVASLAAIAMVAVSVAAVAGWTGYVSTSAALRRADATLDVALQAFEDVFDQVAGTDRIEVVIDASGDDATYEWFAPVSVSSKDTALLELLLAFYDRFAELNADSTELRADTAKAHRRVGDLLMQLRRTDDAEKAYRKALALFQQLDGNGTHRVSVAATRNDVGRVRMESNDGQGARAEFEAALALVANDLSRGARFERARAHELLALLAFPRAPFEPDPHGPPPRRPGERPDREPRPAPPPADRPERAEPFDLTDGLRHFRLAYALSCELAREQPDNPAFQLAAARNGRQLLTFGARRRPIPGGWIQDPERVRIAEESVRRLETLAAAHPDVALYRSELAETCLAVDQRGPMREFGRQIRAEMRAAEAPDPAPYIARALELAEELYLTAPEIPDHRSLLAKALESSARTGTDDLTSVVARLRRAIALRESLPSEVETFRMLLDRFGLANVLLRLDDAYGALDQIEAAAKTVEATAGSDGNGWLAGRMARRSFEPFLSALRSRGLADRADALEERLRALGGR